jgi:flavin reductase (DIM6/NTAB) family NADH-FMN oxidoreductase RutF
LSSPASDPIQFSTIGIAFTPHEWQLNGSFIQKGAIAMLHLKKIKEQEAGDETILYYEGVKGSHRFISSFHQFIIQMYNRLYQKRPGNVFLPGNLYKQVQIAYSIPRNISLVTAGQNDLFNLFPTDLHGPVSEDHYIISLRHDGKACQQVLNTGSILLTQVHSDFYKTVYALGKNHMQEMKVKENYPFADGVSARLQLPLPQSALFYRELELRDSFIHGIHRVMLFKTLYRQRFQDTPSTLAHIHNVYATWRQNNRLPGNYLLR